MAAISNQHWRDRAIQGSETITDIWLVVNAYAGRLSEIVLFGCMLCNILEMLPGVTLSDGFTSTVLGVQIVSLDIGGLSLSSMAHHARDNGAEKAADVATLTSRFLIGLMVVTLLTVSVGVLYPHLKDYTKPVENAMVLIRVVMTVLYSSVIHSLRSSVLEVSPVQPMEAPVSVSEETPAKQIEDKPETPEETVVEELPVQLNEIGAQKESVRVSKSGETKPKQTAKQKALQYLAKHPDCDSVELARKAEITQQYARKILAQLKGNELS